MIEKPSLRNWNYAFEPSAISFIALTRWAAALIVALAHVRALSLAGYESIAPGPGRMLVLPFYIFTSMADEAVIVFFVLSGFLVGGRAVSRTVSGTFDTLDYCTDRFTRIYIVFLPALLVTALLDYVGRSYFAQSGYYDASNILVADRFSQAFQDKGGLTYFVCNLVQLQPIRCPAFGSDYPLWSISFEVWFYVFAGVNLFVANRFRRYLPLSMAAMLVLLPALMGVRSLFYLAIWALGAWVYAWRSGAWFASRWRRWPVLLLALGGIVAASRVSVPVHLFGELIELSNLVVAVLFAIVLHIFTQHRSGVLERSRAINERIANISYSLYLIHFPVLVFVLAALHVGIGTWHFPFGAYDPTNWRNLALFVVLGIVAVAFAFVFAQLTERHTDRARCAVKARLAGGRR